MGGAGAGRDGRRVRLGPVKGEEGEAVAQGLHPDTPAHGRVEGILTVLKNEWTSVIFFGRKNRLNRDETNMVSGLPAPAFWPLESVHPT